MDRPLRSLNEIAFAAAAEYNKSIVEFANALPSGTKLCIHEMVWDLVDDGVGITYRFDAHVLEKRKKCDANVNKLEYYKPARPAASS